MLGIIKENGLLAAVMICTLIVQTSQAPVSMAEMKDHAESPDTGSDPLHPGWTSLNENCTVLLRATAKRFPFLAVAHSIHSLTLRDLRRYFDPLATENNFIPTINRDRAARFPLLSHAPDLHSPDEDMFMTDAMKTLDLTLSHMDDPNWDVKNYSPLENVVHAFHMQEVWTRAKVQFDIIKNAPPSEEACGCVMDVDNNGIFKFLRYISLAIREPELMYSGGLETDTEKAEIIAQAKHDQINWQGNAYNKPFKAPASGGMETESDKGNAELLAQAKHDQITWQGNAYNKPFKAPGSGGMETFTGKDDAELLAQAKHHRINWEGNAYNKPFKAPGSNFLPSDNKKEGEFRLNSAEGWKNMKHAGAHSVAEDYNNALFIYCAVQKAHKK